MDKDKEFLKWLETQNFFTKFANEHPTRSCGIVIRYYEMRGWDIRVFYAPKEIKEPSPNWEVENDYSWMEGYGDHGVSACELYGIPHWYKNVKNHIKKDNEDKTWDEVYLEWKRDIRDKKLENIINEEK